MNKMADNNINNDDKSSPLVDLLGPHLIRNSDGDGYNEISVAELARTKKTIILYFSAHWCPPCRGFTPTLSASYATYKSNKKGHEDGDDDGFELVFVSNDSDAKSFQEYHSEMSFPALPYDVCGINTKLNEKFGVEEIPHLVAVDAMTGEEDTAMTAAVGGNLRSFIDQHEAAAFPLCLSHIQNVKAQAEKKQIDALEKLAASHITVSVPPSSSLLTYDHVCNDKTSEEKNTTIHFGELLEQYEYIGLVFGDGDKADATYNKIQEAEKVLNDNKFIPVYIGWIECQGQSDHSALSERFHSIREEELTDEVRYTLSNVAGGEGDVLTMITIKSKGSGRSGTDGKCEANGKPVISSVDKGLRVLGQFGPTAFPWDEAAVKNAQQVKECRIKNLKERLAGFDFFRSPSTDSGSSDSLLMKDIINKEAGPEDPQKRKYVPVDGILSAAESDKSVLGLYFSAYWCSPCRAFTPELLKVYEEIRTKRGANSFEVVFVSFDDDEKEFKKCYSSMVSPKTNAHWLSLDYDKSRELANDLADVFEVEGFPSLVLLNRDGTILSNDARGYVTKYGADSFPWDAKSIQRREDELLKEEEEEIESQRKYKNGTIVRRILGPIGSVKYDATERVLEFSNAFSTAVLDEHFAKQGTLYYEVEILEEGSGISIAQFGFALGDAFEKTNDETDEGAGDNSKSWGVCGFREELWHDGSSVPLGDRWKIGDVIGFAVNFEEQKIAISKNGNWSKEAGCGAVFENGSLGTVGEGIGIHPALSSIGLKVRLNVQEKDFRFSSPSEEVWRVPISYEMVEENGNLISQDYEYDEFFVE